MVAFSGKVFKVRPGVGGPGTHIGRRLREVRESAGWTQVALADRLGLHQSALSRLEKQSDILVSTLRGYIEGLGATLRIDANFNELSERITQFEEAPFEGQTSDDQFVLPIIGEDHFIPRRDVVFSIKPQYSQPILDGTKTVELRRRFPTDVPGGTIALIYSTSPVRALTGIAEIAGVVKQSPSDLWTSFEQQACIARKDFDRYFAGVESACAIKLRRARPLRRSLTLAELRERFSFEPPQSFLYAKPELRQALSYECSEVSD